MSKLSRDFKHLAKWSNNKHDSIWGSAPCGQAHLLPSLRTALQQVPTGALITSVRFCSDCRGELCRMRYLLNSYLQPELDKHLSFCTKERKSYFSICSPSTGPQLYSHSSHMVSQRLTLQQLSREADVTGTLLVCYWWCWPMSGRAPHGLLE